QACSPDSTSRYMATSQVGRNRAPTISIHLQPKQPPESNAVHHLAGSDLLHPFTAPNMGQVGHDPAPFNWSACLRTSQITLSERSRALHDVRHAGHPRPPPHKPLLHAFSALGTQRRTRRHSFDSFATQETRSRTFIRPCNAGKRTIHHTATLCSLDL